MEDYIYHHGIKGQHWGIRRYQRLSGDRTTQGQYHRADLEGYTYGGRKRGDSRPASSSTGAKTKPQTVEETSGYKFGKTINKDQAIRIAKAGAMAAVAAAAVYGAYKLNSQDVDGLSKLGNKYTAKLLQSQAGKLGMKANGLASGTVGNILANELVAYGKSEGVANPMMDLAAPALGNVIGNTIARGNAKAVGTAKSAVSNQNGKATPKLTLDGQAKTAKSTPKLTLEREQPKQSAPKATVSKTPKFTAGSTNVNDLYNNFGKDLDDYTQTLLKRQGIK